MSDIIENLGDNEAVARDERRRAIGALLRCPFLTDDGPDREGFAMVRRQATELQSWFRQQLGYRLVVDHEFARLYKRSPPSARGAWEDHPRGALTISADPRPFDRRRYSLLCLSLAALESLDATQTVLSELALAVRGLAADHERVEPLDLERFAERRAFVDAIRYLVSFRILALTDGSDSSFVSGTGDALYDIDSRRLALMLSSPVPPSLAPGPETLSEEVYPPTEDGRNLRLRHRLMRRLVEQPVLYLTELDPDERTYLSYQRHYLVDQVESRTPLNVEIRADGLTAIDPDGNCTDLVFPGTRHSAHAALLLADEIVRRRPAEPGPKTTGEAAGATPTLSRGELLDIAVRLLRTHGWRNAYRDDPTGATLLDEALEVLADLGLVRRHPEGVEPLPALFRYRYAPPVREEMP